MLSVPFSKAMIVGFFATCLMVLQIEKRLVTLAVLVLSVVGCASFVGVSLSDVKRLAIDFHMVNG
jgi:hypothetical protein